MSDGDDRSEKLKERFGSFADETGEASQAPNTDEASNTPLAGEASVTDETPVRDLPTKLLYLEEDFIKELELAFDEVNLMYKREHGQEIEKNRHWYPLLLRLGFHAIGDVEELTLAEYEALLEEVD